LRLNQSSEVMYFQAKFFCSYYVRNTSSGYTLHYMADRLINSGDMWFNTLMHLTSFGIIILPETGS